MTAFVFLILAAVVVPGALMLLSPIARHLGPSSEHQPQAGTNQSELLKRPLRSRYPL